MNYAYVLRGDFYQTSLTKVLQSSQNLATSLGQLTFNHNSTSYITTTMEDDLTVS